MTVKPKIRRDRTPAERGLGNLSDTMERGKDGLPGGEFLRFPRKGDLLGSPWGRTQSQLWLRLYILLAPG